MVPTTRQPWEPSHSQAPNWQQSRPLEPQHLLLASVCARSQHVSVGRGDAVPVIVQLEHQTYCASPGRAAHCQAGVLAQVTAPAMAGVPA
jgi:hypothetical protein